MQKEIKLQQKLFDKETLTWKNKGHAQNEQNRVKEILRIFDFVDNPIQFDFFVWFYIILVQTLKVAAYLRFCHWSKFQASVSFPSLFITYYVHIGIIRNP